VVLCGSAASWMVKHLVYNTGGLYNRITRRIYLQPFSLLETEQYLQSRNVQLNRYELVQLYMAIGGIPHYLKEIKDGGMSVAQHIDALCFQSTGLLRDEFKLMFHALFEQADKHIALLRALAGSHQGLTRPRLIAEAKVSENGSTSKVIEELEHSGFITTYVPFGKTKKDMLHRLTDEYTLFFLRFIESGTQIGTGAWQQMSQSTSYKTWCGYAFETLCLKHIDSLKKAMSIGGVYSTASAFYRKGTETEPGVQIDLLLERADQVINLFEMKFSISTITLTSESAQALRRKTWAFAEVTKTKKRLSLVLVSPFGLQHNAHSLGLVDNSLVLDDLFES
jgi:uncharacterized protein